MPTTPLRLVLAAAALYFASAAGPALSAAPRGASNCSAEGLCLAVTVAEDDGDPTRCGSEAAIAVVPGDRLNYCYTVTNAGSTTLNWHSLSDSVHGVLFQNVQHPLAPGESWQYNRVFEADGEVQPEATWLAADVLPNQAASGGAYEFIDVVATGTPLNLANDAGAPVQLPFPFTVYDTTSDRLCINNDGFVVLGLPADHDDACARPSLLWQNFPLPYPLPGAQPYPLLAPLWMDLDGIYGNVYFGSVGDAPNRKAVVEWYQVESWNQVPGTGQATFEIVFDEASGTFSYQYQDVTFDDPGNAYLDNGGGATIGLGYDAVLYDAYSYDQPVLSAATALAWTPVPRMATTATAAVSVTLAGGAPAIGVSPASLEASVEAGSKATAVLTIANAGDVALAWHVAGAAGTPAPAPLPSSAAGTPSASSHGGASSSPAFGFNFADAGNSAYSLIEFPDLAEPQNAKVVASAPEAAFFRTGTFVNDDFTREYVASNTAEDGNTDWILYTFGTADGALAPVGPLSQYNDAQPALSLIWRAFAWDAITATLYGIATSEDFSGWPYSILYAIDPATAQAREIAALPYGTYVQAIAVDRNGRMYGADLNYDARLVTVDKTSGALSAIGSLGLPSSAGYSQLTLSVDLASGALYLVNGGQLYSSDPASGAAAAIGPLFDGTGTGALAIASPGACTASAPVAWLKLDTAGGALDAGSSAEVNATFDASGLAAGVYTTNLCVHANDPSRRLTAVPVTLTVSAGTGDRIFADGFDD